MSSRKRERLEIIKDILVAIQKKGDKVRPTHIIYKSNLSSDMLKQYLKDLLQKEFLTETTDKKNIRYYSLTPKGFNYIKDYKMIISFMESYGLN